jgi:hypothetical protein
LAVEKEQVRAALVIQKQMRSKRARHVLARKRQDMALKRSAKEAEEKALLLSKSATKIQSRYRVKKSRERFQAKRKAKRELVQKMRDEGDHEGASKLEDGMKQEEVSQKAHEQLLSAQQEVCECGQDYSQPFPPIVEFFQCNVSFI